MRQALPSEPAPRDDAEPIWAPLLRQLRDGLADGTLGAGRAQMLRIRIVDLGGELPPDQVAAHEACRAETRRLMTADDAAVQERLLEARAAHRLRDCGLPAGLVAKARWNDGRLHPASTRAVWEWCRAARLTTYLVLQGPVGCGKSCVVTLAMMMLAKRPDVESLRYVRASAALELMADFGQTTPTDWWTCRVLCIDDLGAHDRPSERALAVMADLLDGREQEGLTTIVTLNVARASTLSAQLGPRIVDRLTSRENSCAVRWPADFESLRQRPEGQEG